MKSIADRLAEQQAASKEFARRNFGAMMGDGYPELVREILANRGIASGLSTGYMIAMMRSLSLCTKIAENSMGYEQIAQEPAVYEQPTQWLYWGIEIGRQLQREEAAAEVVAR